MEHGVQRRRATTELQANQIGGPEPEMKGRERERKRSDWTDTSEKGEKNEGGN